MPTSIGRCLSLLLLAVTIAGCQSAAKPDSKAEMPALVFADQYAFFIAHHQYDRALEVSTPENAQLINTEIKPFLQELADLNNKQRLSFKEIQFLSAYLVDGDEGHLVVLEALIPSPLLTHGERVMLTYELRKKGDGFEVLSTRISLDPAEEQ